MNLLNLKDKNIYFRCDKTGQFKQKETKKLTENLKKIKMGKLSNEKDNRNENDRIIVVRSKLVNVSGGELYLLVHCFGVSWKTSAQNVPIRGVTENVNTLRQIVILFLYRSSLDE